MAFAIESGSRPHAGTKLMSFPGERIARKIPGSDLWCIHLALKSTIHVQISLSPAARKLVSGASSVGGHVFSSFPNLSEAFAASSTPATIGLEDCRL